MLSELFPASSISNDKIIKIFIGTWNMNCQKHLTDIDKFVLPENIQCKPDVIVVGTQESCKYTMIKWEMSIQDAIGSTYILKSKNYHGSLQLVIFIRRELFCFCFNLVEKKINLNKFKFYKTKGAVILGITIFNARFLFISAHLTAHQSKFENRKNELKKLMDWCTINSKSTLKLKKRKYFPIILQNQVASVTP